MSKKVYVFLAEGFEEIEALTVVDLLRRVKIDVQTVAMKFSPYVRGAHGIEVKADHCFGDKKFNDGDMLVLPGGMPGTTNLLKHKGLKALILKYYEEDKYLAAICAAPSVLGACGVLNEKKATCFPGFEQELKGAEVVNDRVVTDGKIITSRGMGTAIDFGLEIISQLIGGDTASELAKGIQYK